MIPADYHPIIYLNAAVVKSKMWIAAQKRPYLFILGVAKKVLKKRFPSLFDSCRKTKVVVSLLMAVLLLGIIGLSAGCNQNTDCKTEDSIIYKNETLGFSLEFPSDWRDKYIIKESVDNISIFNKKIYENYDQAGWLLTIERVTGELITKEDMQQAPVSQKIILQGNGYTYFTIEPSDVQYPPDNKELSSEYQAMSKRIPKIYNSISILGKQKPKAVNEGFKVVGSSFFTVEIPIDWEIKRMNGSPFLWSIYTGNKNVGEIELIPYKSEGTNETPADVGVMREYLFDDETSREFRITLKSGYADKVIMKKIKNRFEFAAGPYNVVDLQYTAEQYLAGSGRKIFGTIKDLQMENGKPAIRVNVMKFLADNGNNQHPNGFQIEDLNQIETYTLDGVHIAPLVAPNYNTYGAYEMPLLDETFLANYKNYKHSFYDFIIGSDGQLKIVLEHYVP
jgi:hypothetical protein